MLDFYLALAAEMLSIFCDVTIQLNIYIPSLMAYILRKHANRQNAGKVSTGYTNRK